MPDSLIGTEGYNRLKACKHGFMLYNIHDLFIGRSLDAYGEFTEHELDLLKQVVRPGDLVLDVGANIGTHTVAFARWVGATGAVVAFEPQRLTFQTLCANVALNSLTNVHTVRAAVGEAPGTVMVPALDPAMEANFGALSLAKAQEGEPVDMVPIDALEVPACRLMKIDVEGMEDKVLAGAAQTIARHRPIMYVENERRDMGPELVRQLRGLGYDLYWHTIPYYNPHNFFGNPENIWTKGLVGRNMVCLPQEMPQTMTGFERVVLPGE